MKQTTKFSIASFSIATKGLAVGLALALTAVSIVMAQPGTRPADIVGLAQVGHNVADLERSIKFFEAIDFKVAEAPSKWGVDKEVNQLANTPGAESRTAVMRVQ